MCVTSTFGFKRRFERAVKLEAKLNRGVVTLCASCHEKSNNSESQFGRPTSSSTAYRGRAVHPGNEPSGLASGTEPGIHIVSAVLNATRMGQCAVVSERPADKTRKKLDSFSEKKAFLARSTVFKNSRLSFLADLGNLATTRNVLIGKMNHS